MQKRATATALLYVLVVAILSLAPHPAALPLGTSSAEAPLVASWSSITWCPCQAASLPGAAGAAYVGGGYTAIMASDGSLYLAGPQGILGPLPGVSVESLHETAWGSVGGAVLLAGSRSVGAILYANDSLALWVGSLYAQPRPGSAWLDPLTGLLWAVDVNGNLYTALIGSGWEAVAGPAAPSSPLSEAIARALTLAALNYTLRQALADYPNSTIISYNATPIGAPAILWAGVVYNVSNGTATPTPLAVPVLASIQVDSWVLLNTSEGEINYTASIPSSGVLFLDLTGNSVAGGPAFWTPTTAPELSGLVASWSPQDSEGLAAAPLLGGGVQVFAAYGTPWNLSAAASPPLTASQRMIAPSLEPGRPALILWDTTSVYYYALEENRSLLHWSYEPPEGVADVAPTFWGVSVAAHDRALLVSYRGGALLWAGAAGLPFPVVAVAPEPSGVLLGHPGGVVSVGAPRLVAVKVNATASDHPLGPGFRVDLAGPGGSYYSYTDASGEAVFYVPPGLYNLTASDPLLGPKLAGVNASGDWIEASIEYSITTIKPEVSLEADPLGLLPGGPAAGASAVIVAECGEWNSTVNATVGPDGTLEVALPAYLSWADGIPLSTSVNYTLTLSYPGYLPYVGPLSTTVTLEPVLYNVTFTFYDLDTGGPIASGNASLTLLLTETGRSASITLPSGGSTIQLPPGLYQASAGAPGYEEWGATLTVDGPSTVEVSLTRVRATLQLAVYDSQFWAPINALLTLTGPGVNETLEIPAGGAALTLPWGEYNLSLVRAGYQLWTSSIYMAPGETLNLSVGLDPDWYNVSLTVLDALTGLPTPFRATAYAQTPIGFVAIGQVSSQDGHATLTLRPWNASILIEASGYPQLWLPAPSPASLTVELPRLNATLWIAAFDTLSYTLLGNFTVTLSGPVNLSLAASGPTPIVLPWGDYTVTLRAPYYEEATFNLSLEPSSTLNVTVPLEPLYKSLTLTVVDRYTLQPVPVTFEAYAITPAGPIPVAGGQSANGTFALQAPLPWEIALNLTPLAPYTGAYVNTSLTLDPRSSPPTGTVALERVASTISIRAVDALTGKDVEGALVLLEGPVNTTMNPGDYAIVPWGSYTLVVGAPYYERLTTQVTLQPGGKLEFVAELHRMRGSIVIVAYDSVSGRPVERPISVFAYSPVSGDTVQASGSRNVTLELRLLETYNLTVSAPGYRPVTVQVAAATNGTLVEYVTLYRTNITLVIHAIDAATGSPIPNAIIIVSGPAASASAVANATGTAVFSLPWGVYAVEATAPLHVNTSLTVSVPPETRRHEVNVYMDRSRATLTVLVLDKDTGEPLSATLILESPGLGRIGPIDVNGRTSIDLRAGVYNVTITAPGYKALVQTVLVTGSKTLDAYLSRLLATVTITLYDQPTGQLVPAVLRIVDTLYGTTTMVNASSGVASVTLLQGVPYTVNIAPLSPYHRPLTVNIRVPVGKDTYKTAVKLDRINVNVTLIATTSRGKPLDNALIVLRVGHASFIAASGQSVIIPAGTYTVEVHYKGRAYYTTVSVAGPGIVRVAVGVPFWVVYNKYFYVILAAVIVIVASPLVWRYRKRRPTPERESKSKGGPFMSPDSIIGG